MNPISENTINKAFEEVGKLSIEESQKLIDNLTETQPNILFYLLNFGKDILNESEKQIQYFLGVVICHSFNLENEKIKLIDQNTILNNEEKNRKLFSSIDDKSPEEANELLKNALADYSQAELLKTMLIIVIEEYEEEDSQIQDENLNLIFTCLKTIIDSYIF